MCFLKKMSLTTLILFSLYLIVSADDAGAFNAEAKALSENQQKLNNFLNETELEIRIRQKIEKEMQDKVKIANSSARGASAINEKQPYWYIVLMYIPNRIIDLTDIITVDGGVGPEASFEITFTKWVQFGGSYGDRYFIEKGFNRQDGGGYSSGHNASFACWNSEKQVVDYVFGTVKPYVSLDEDNSSKPCPCKEPYRSKVVDFWRIGVRTGWIVDFGFNVHPTAIANFFTGFCFVRLTNTNEL